MKKDQEKARLYTDMSFKWLDFRLQDDETILTESKKGAILDVIRDLENHLRSIGLKDKDLKTYMSWLNKIWLGVEKAKI